MVAARAHGLHREDGRLRATPSPTSPRPTALLLRPDRLAGDRRGRPGRDDRHRAGRHPAARAQRPAARALGLALHNMGDIDRQTVAGAISTGTHGTGGRWASLSAQVAGLELVTARRRVVQARRRHRPRTPTCFEAARVGLGALGILTAVTFRVEPALHARGRRGADAVGRGASTASTSWSTANHHFEMYWFPHTDRMLTKRNNRTLDDARAAVAGPGLGRRRAALQHASSAAVNRVGNRAPRADPARSTGSSARALSAPHLHRRPAPGLHLAAAGGLPGDGVRRARARPAWRRSREVRALIERSGWRISFPVEIRDAPADDISLSTAYGRDSVYLAFHINARTDHTAYFAGVEAILRGLRRPPALGQAAHPDRRGPRAGVPALRGLPRAARPARPGPAVHQRLPGPGAGPDEPSDPRPSSPAPGRSRSGTTRARRGSSAPTPARSRSCSAAQVVARTSAALPGPGDQPPADVLPAAVGVRRRARCGRRRAARTCEWKGRASYLDLVGGDRVAERAGWFYPSPTRGVRRDRRPRRALPRR